MTKGVFVSINGCNVAGLGPYGNEWIATPCLDALAAEAVVFDSHYASRCEPAEARASWRSGRYHIGCPTEGIPDVIKTLQTAGITVRPVRESDLDEPGRPALREAVEAALNELASVERWLLWVEIDRLVPPWDVPADRYEAYFAPLDDELPEGVNPDEYELPPPCDNPESGEFDAADIDAFEWLHCSFAAMVTEVDEELGELFGLFRGRGLADDAFWLVTSDAGYPLGEHGSLGDHNPIPHEEAAHVPLILRLPSAAEAGRRVADLTQGVDIALTLLDAFGVPSNTSTHGHGVWPLARGGRDWPREYAVTAWRAGDAEAWALRSSDWTFVLPVEPAGDGLLFEKPDDRFEVHNIRVLHLDFCDRLADTLRGFADATRAAESDWPPLPHHDDEEDDDDDATDRPDA